MTTLEVMICTIGPDALMRLDLNCYPQTHKVMYTIGWQQSGEQPEIPEKMEHRKDIRILFSPAKGLSINRNHLLQNSVGDILLVGDDDVEYRSEDLLKIIEAFEQKPQCSLLTFQRYQDDKDSHNRIHTNGNQNNNQGFKSFPIEEFRLSKPAKGYYISSIELAFRRMDAVGKVRFDERFGKGTEFPFGEEEIFVAECIRKGIEGRYIPTKIVRHHGNPSEKGSSMEQARTKGAIFKILHPYTWPFRMAAHALGNFPNSPISAIKYCKEWMRGIRRLSV